MPPVPQYHGRHRPEPRSGSAITSRSWRTLLAAAGIATVGVTATALDPSLARAGLLDRVAPRDGAGPVSGPAVPEGAHDRGAAAGRDALAMTTAHRPTKERPAAAPRTPKRPSAPATSPYGSGARVASPALPHLARARAASLTPVLRTPAAASARTTRALAATLPPLRSVSWTTPVAGTHMSSMFGRRWGRLHAGIDFAGPVGIRLRSMSSGVVTFAGQQRGYGNLVEMTYWDGTLVKYGHLQSISVRTGQRLTTGQAVGSLGDTGHSTGPHLHLEVHPAGGSGAVDPLPWLVQRGVLPQDAPRRR